ncbi:MAG: site-specific DNA-methyltransferase [Syntrophales bacterium]|nr:site-specific DNA-methyltransferase [Syntrophales bacterium]
MANIEKLDLKSKNITDEQKAKLKELFPEVLTEGKVDFEKLRLTLGDEIDEGEERFGMTWPGKRDCFKVIQEPSIGTLKPCREESVDFDTTENLFIEGDNLEVLKLLQKSYYGKVKMIYIDPPYNTGNEFIYPDKYSESLETYLAYTGQVDDEGRKFSTNTETDGRFHSKWLNMMYPRLFLAKNLLREDGVIFISIDDNEVYNLRKICDEVFGEENYRNECVIRRGAKSVQAQFETWDKLGSGFERIIIYSKRSDYRFPKQLRRLDEVKQGSWNNHWRGTERPTMRYELFGIIPSSGQWRWGKERSFAAIENYKKLLLELNVAEESITQEQIDEYYTRKFDDGDDLDFLRLSSNSKPEHYVPPTDSTLLNDIWFDLPISSSKEVRALFDKKKIFDNPKPTALIKRMLAFGSGKDIILDFFSGSCTTTHAVLDLNKEDGGNRKFIMVQLPEPTDENSEAHNAGYKTISDIGKERIRRVIKQINKEKEGTLAFKETKQDLGFKVFKLDKSNFKIWDGAVDDKPIHEQLEFAIDHIDPNSKEDDILYEILLKSGFELTTPLETLTLEGKKVYSVAEGALLICLEMNLTKELIRAIAKMEPQRVVCLDSGFEGNDQLKTNAVQIMKTSDVESFRTV